MEEGSAADVLNLVVESEEPQLVVWLEEVGELQENTSRSDPLVFRVIHLLEAPVDQVVLKIKAPHLFHSLSVTARMGKMAV